MHKGERFNSISHLIGTGFAIAGLAVLVVKAAMHGDPWRIVSFSIYGATLVILYLASTLYHGAGDSSKKALQKFDHLAIYLLIAGTYTPFTLVTLRGAWGWTIFGIVWGLAIVGILIDTLQHGGRRIIQVVIYLLMGWLAMVAFKPLLAALPGAGFAWLMTGGVFYTGGVVFYALEGKMPFAHEVWHLFVLGGSISHYVAILVYVL
ncbi:MAG: hemolysin III family protein [Nitrospirota bacterium]|nr:hemolysin III family protein [Nitrospirota bacterium]